MLIGGANIVSVVISGSSSIITKFIYKLLNGLLVIKSMVVVVWDGHSNSISTYPDVKKLGVILRL
jgi:hypothetical protein